MEQPLIRSQRKRFLDELAAEGAQLLALADTEAWFGAGQGRRLGARFLAHRLQSMQWELETMRQAPLRLFVEMICPGITRTMPPVRLAFPDKAVSRICKVSAGEVWGGTALQRWEVEDAQLLHPVNSEMRWDGKALLLQWQSAEPLPSVLDCPLYDRNGYACWELYAAMSALRPVWEGVDGERVDMQCWQMPQRSLLDFWHVSRRPTARCGWRFLLPPRNGPMPLSVRLRMEWVPGHPLTCFSGLEAVLEKADGFLVRPLLGLRALERGDDLDAPLRLRSCDPNSQVPLLVPVADGFFPGQETDVSQASLWLAGWARWLLSGRQSLDLQELLPSLKWLKWRNQEQGGFHFHVKKSQIEPDALTEIGRELYQVRNVIRQCNWLTDGGYVQDLQLHVGGTDA